MPSTTAHPVPDRHGQNLYTTDAEALHPGAAYLQEPEGEDRYRLELDALDLSGDGEEDEDTERTQRDLQEARFIAQRISELPGRAFPSPTGRGGPAPPGMGTS